MSKKYKYLFRQVSGDSNVGEITAFQHGSLGGGALHSLANNFEAGFMSPTQNIRVNSVLTSVDKITLGTGSNSSATQSYQITAQAGGDFQIDNVQFDLLSYVSASNQWVMYAPLNMTGSKIVNLGTPTLASDAATKAYVDANAGGPSNLTTSTLTLSASNSDPEYRVWTQGNGDFQIDDSIQDLLSFVSSSQEWNFYKNVEINNNLNVVGSLTQGGNSVLTTASTIDADTLDSLDSTAFLRSNAADNLTAVLTVSGGRIDFAQEGNDLRWNSQTGLVRFAIQQDDDIGLQINYFDDAGSYSSTPLTIATSSGNFLVGTTFDDGSKLRVNGDIRSLATVIGETGLNANNNLVTNVQYPTASTDAANKQYVDDNAGGGSPTNLDGHSLSLTGSGATNPIITLDNTSAGAPQYRFIAQDNGDLQIDDTNFDLLSYNSSSLQWEFGRNVLVQGNSVLTTASTIDADTLDSLDSTSFLRSDSADTLGAKITLNGSGVIAINQSGNGLRWENGGTVRWAWQNSGGDDLTLNQYDDGGAYASSPMVIVSGSGNVLMNTSFDDGSKLRVNGDITSLGTFNGDGSGLTGVNATTLDSIDSTGFLRANTADELTAEMTLGAGGIISVNNTGNAIRWEDGGTIRWSLQLASGDNLVLNQFGDGGGFVNTPLNIASGSGNFLLFTTFDAGNELRVNGDVEIIGNLSKGSGTFKIDHPVEPEDKWLYHGFIESPRYDLVYRGEAKLVNGRATVNIDEASDMTEGTFEALTQNVQVTSLQNIDSFDRVKPTEVDGNIFMIECENENSTDRINWVVIAERADEHIKESSGTDNKGRLMVEVNKTEEEKLHLPKERAKRKGNTPHL